MMPKLSKLKKKNPNNKKLAAQEYEYEDLEKQHLKYLFVRSTVM